MDTDPSDVGKEARSEATLDYGSGRTVATRIGKKPTASTFKPFLVGPIHQEITGLCKSSDSKVLFVNVQHPGAEKRRSATSATRRTTPATGRATPATAPSARPRGHARTRVTKNDGGLIGT